MDEAIRSNGLLTGLMLACAIFAGWAGWRLGPQLISSPGWRNWARLFLGSLFLLICLDGFREILGSVINSWNGPRLVPTFTLASTYHSYYDPDSGPVTGNIYGPGLSFSYLPCLLFSEPASAIRCGSLLSVLWLLLPAAWLLGTVVGDPSRNSARWLLLLFGFYWLLTSPAWLRQVAFNIHADAPAIGLGLLACLFAHRLAERNTTSDLWLTAAFAHASVATKQTMLPILLALPIWFWLRGERATAKKMVLTLAAVGIGLWGLIACSYGWPAVWFNLVYIPGHHPWYDGLGRFPWVAELKTAHGLAVLGEALFDFILSNGWLGLVLLATAISGRKYRQPQTKPQLPLISLLWLVGVMLLPMSLLGRVKVGGDYNAFSYSTVFLSLATVIYCYSVITRIQLPASLSLRLSPVAHLLVMLATATVFALSLVNGARTVWSAERDTVCHEQMAFDAMQAAPETIYFPWQPLAGLLAEHRLYHFSYGVYDRWLAGRPLTPEHFAAHLPPKMEAMGVFKGSNVNYLRASYLTNYSPAEIRSDMYLFKPEPTKAQP